MCVRFKPWCLAVFSWLLSLWQHLRLGQKKSAVSLWRDIHSVSSSTLRRAVRRVSGDSFCLCVSSIFETIIVWALKWGQSNRFQTRLCPTAGVPWFLRWRNIMCCEDFLRTVLYGPGFDLLCVAMEITLKQQWIGLVSRHVAGHTCIRQRTEACWGTWRYCCLKKDNSMQLFHLSLPELSLQHHTLQLFISKSSPFPHLNTKRRAVKSRLPVLWRWWFTSCVQTKHNVLFLFYSNIKVFNLFKFKKQQQQQPPLSSLNKHLVILVPIIPFSHVWRPLTGLYAQVGVWIRVWSYVTRNYVVIAVTFVL